MPGMRLDFLNNVSQRAATGRSMPLHQVEAVVLYGKPEQRGKVIQKVLANAYALCLNKTTHYLLHTVLERCDNNIGVQVLFQLRRKIVDLSHSPVGNIIVQEMIDKLPVRQKKEIAEMFVLNTEEDEFRQLCQHPFGNRVAQKIIENSITCEIVEERLVPFLWHLALHPHGQRAVASYIDSTEEGWRQVCKAILGLSENVLEEGGSQTSKVVENAKEGCSSEGKSEEYALIKQVSRLFRANNDSMTASALLRHPMVPVHVKDVLCAHLLEYVVDYLNPEMAAASASSEPVATTQDEFAPPQFDDISLSAKPHTNVKGGRLPQHHHVYITVFEKGDPAQRKELWDTISRTKGLVEHLVSSRIVVDVAVAAFKTYPESRDTLWSALANCGERNTKEIATDPVGTLLLRAVMEVESERVGIEQQHQLAEAAVELSQDPVSSPVLQKLLECSQEQEAIASLIFERIRSELKCLVLHNSASYLVQALVQHCGHKLRSQLTKELLAAFDDMRHMLAFAQGSRVMQKLLAYGSDEVVAKIADLLLNAAEGSESKENNQLKGDEHNVNEEGQGGESDTGKGVNNSKLPRWKIREMNRQKHYTVESNAIISYALHSHACYVIQALLRECCSRALEVQRKRLMKELKPHVFELAVSPWAGRIVLGAMQQCGSPQLKEAMNNVVYLKAEAWLTDAGAKEKERGSGLDPTLRQTLRRVRKEDLGEQNASNDSPARKKPFRAPGR